jgi:hypothetical protein
VGPLFGGKVVVEVPAEGFDFLEEVERWEVLLEFANEENIGCSEERISGEAVLEVVEDGLGSRVDIGWGCVDAGHGETP